MSAASLKFANPNVTAKGETRATVKFKTLETLWFNTGTLCNIECPSCYIASSPSNDQLQYLTRADVEQVLAEANSLDHRLHTLGFTGGEPFMNPELPEILEQAFQMGFQCLVLTNAMRPMMRPRVQTSLKKLQSAYASKLTLRISLDHYRRELHDQERGIGAFDETIEGIQWLQSVGIQLAIAGRLRWNEPVLEMRTGFAELFSTQNLQIDANDPASLVLFPEMDEKVDVPEITVDCWDILKKNPDDMMCASSRMVVRRKGSSSPTITACTLLPYAPQFDLGPSLAGALTAVKLNHPHCAKFCVLGGGSCKV